MSDSPLPPLSADGVFTVYGSSVISAPIETVWKHLLDFPSYKEWNPFVRGQTIIDSKTGKALDVQVLTTSGARMNIYPVHLPPTMGEPGLFQSNSTYVKCNVFDAQNHRVAWITDGALPRFLLFAERWQTLTDVGNGQVKYESTEVFSGILSYLVKLFVGKNLVLGVDAMAEGLKKRSEEHQS